MNIQDKTFSETKTACKMQYSITEINLDEGIMSVFILLQDDMNRHVQSFTKNYPVKEFINQEAICKKICEDIEVSPC